MRNTRNMRIHYSNEEKEAARRAYLHMANKSLVNIRLTSEQSKILQQDMQTDGWTNMSAFIRYRLFGLDPDRKLDELIRAKDPEFIALLLRGYVDELANRFEYVIFCYDQDMSRLYQKESVDEKEWADVTNKWMSALVRTVSKTLVKLKRVALLLGLENAPTKESDSLNIDLDNASQKELDAMAERLFKNDID